MAKTYLRALTILIALSAIGAAGFFYLQNRTVEVRVAVPETDVPVRVFGLGTIEARILSRVGFEVGAAIVELRADHGDLVKKGDVLARLQSSEQEAKVLRAQAILRNGEANLKKIEASLEKARVILTQRREANRRKQTLIGRGVVSAQTAEETQRDEDVSKGDLAIATSDVDIARAVLADGRAQLEYEKTLLAQRTLVAPFDAMVVERSKELGAVIKAGDPIFTLIAPESVWALAYIDESRAGAVAVGQSAIVRLRSLPQQAFEARVERIGIESDRVSEERRVYVKCDKCSPHFFLGEQAEVLITVDHLKTALLVPEAIVKGFDTRVGQVWTVEDGRLRLSKVSFGHRTDDGRVQIIGGLPEGARVVVELTDGLREGRAATIATEVKR